MPHNSRARPARKSASASSASRSSRPALALDPLIKTSGLEFLQPGTQSRQLIGRQFGNRLFDASTVVMRATIAHSRPPLEELVIRCGPPHGSVSNAHAAPPPAFCLISPGSSVHTSFETRAMTEPAATPEGISAAAAVAVSRWPTGVAAEQAGDHALVTRAQQRRVLGHHGSQRERRRPARGRRRRRGGRHRSRLPEDERKGECHRLLHVRHVCTSSISPTASAATAAPTIWHNFSPID